MGVLEKIGDVVEDVGDGMSYVTGFNPFTLKVNEAYSNALSDLTGINEIEGMSDWWNGKSILQRAGMVAAFVGGAAALGGAGAAGAGAEVGAGTVAAEGATAELLGLSNAAELSTLEASLPTLGVDAAGGATAGIEASGAEFLTNAAPSATSGATTTAVAEGAAGDLAAAGEFAGVEGATGQGMDLSNRMLLEGGDIQAVNQAGHIQTAGQAAETANSGGGIIDSVLKFGQKNPALTGAGLIVGGNLVQSGMNYMAMSEKQEKELENAQKMEAWKRRFAEQGAVGVTSPVSAPAQAGGVLRRPDGTAVYGPGGIINGAMRR